MASSAPAYAAVDGSGCVSGACMPTAGGGARICCSQACSGTRNSCRSTGQGCVQCESATQCGNGCDTTQGVCIALRVPGATCTVASQCSTNRCVPAADGNNLSRCCPTCAAGQLCTSGGACINSQSDLGGNCQGNADCRVGTCVANVCCNTTCDLNCTSCSSNGLSCTSNGACDAFSCAAPNPPGVFANFPANPFVLGGGTPPAARGGTVRDGRYIPTRIDLYSNFDNGIRIPTYEFRRRSVQIAEQDVISFTPLQNFAPEFHFAGTFTTSGTTLSFDTDLCEAQFNGVTLLTQTVQYTATADGLVIISQQGTVPVVVTYARQ
jgi:hypothetical protein